MERFKELRLELRKTGLQVTLDSRISQRRSSNYENDILTTDLDTLKELASYYNVTTDYLLCKFDRRNPYVDFVETLSLLKSLDKIW